MVPPASAFDALADCNFRLMAPRYTALTVILDGVTSFTGQTQTWQRRLENQTRQKESKRAKDKTVSEVNA